MSRLAAAIIVALINLLILAALSFVCGSLMAVFDSIDKSKPVQA
jgi:Flp pilus assembly pilin Flp